MDHPGGSYAFGNFRNNEEELGRLVRQAQIGLHLERTLWPKFGVKPGIDVIDVGSGPGVVSCALAKAVSPGHVLGIDANELMLDVARRTQQAERVENVEFTKGDVYDLHMNSASADLAYARFLFQHLSDSSRALREIWRVLRPGGTIGVIDIDDAWLLLHPEPKSLASFLKRAAGAQARGGGTRSIGRSFYGLLRTAGFTDVTVGVFPVTSQEIGLENLVNLVTGFKRELIPPSELAEAQQELAEIRQLLNMEHGWGAIGIFYGVGRKPQ
jgi:ubiquinone/menaquinone biosynthesis C-methylase UbiE